MIDIEIILSIVPVLNTILLVVVLCKIKKKPKKRKKPMLADTKL